MSQLTPSWGADFIELSLTHCLVVRLYSGGVHRNLASVEVSLQKLIKEELLDVFISDFDERARLKAGRRLPRVGEIAPIVDDALKPYRFAQSAMDVPSSAQRVLAMRLRLLYARHALSDQPTYDPFELLEIFAVQRMRTYPSEREALLGFRRSLAILFILPYAVDEMELLGKLPDPELLASVVKTALSEAGVIHLADASLQIQSALMKRLDELFQGALAAAQPENQARHSGETALTTEALRAMLAEILRTKL
ncbi:MAG TPA: hypothetical protein VNG90_03500 [Candidatus Acidoferrum sp.]|nr:hypothetical protein [Candidatus Acidoferrum sp.]